MIRESLKIIIAVIVTTTITYYVIDKKNQRQNSKLIKNVKLNLKRIDKQQFAIYSSLPIYSDYINPEKKRTLRKYLLLDHLRQVKSQHLPPVLFERQIKLMVKNKNLVNIDKGSKNYYFYNVPKKFRYLTPIASDGLNNLMKKYQINLNNRNKDIPQVKLAISSALRPSDYQRTLRKLNVNASFISSHSYGASFDIFYDDYFVDFKIEKNFSSNVAKRLVEKTKNRLGFYAGDGLRRQLHSILVETLIELQNEHKIYAIWERNQRCYHITPLNN